MKSKEMTPETCRAARALVGISQADLADLAGVTTLTVRNYEAGKTGPSLKTWRAMKTALEKNVRFIDGDETEGPGVRLRKP
jgi:DNA-binding XRE family transcriptional regulator